MDLLHTQLLEWFSANAGIVKSWSDLSSQGMNLVCRPKGIYKPKGWRYALSIRHSLNGPYQESVPADHSDWEWEYREEDNARSYTFSALQACMEDGIPVGAVKQVEGKGKSSKYLVMGLGKIVRYHSGLYTVRGPYHFSS